MGLMENQNTEFKREYVSELHKEVVAFVNSDGGKILVGVEDMQQNKSGFYRTGSN